MRFIRLLLLSIPCGAILTVAVAWVSVLPSREGDHKAAYFGIETKPQGAVHLLKLWRRLLVDQALRVELFPAGVPLDQSEAILKSQLIPGGSAGDRRDDDIARYRTLDHPSASGRTYVIHLQAGFPMRCLWLEIWPASRQTLTARFDWYTGISLNAPGWTPRQYGTRSIRLPLQPIVHGLVINTLFWSVISLAPLSLARAVRNRRRRRRGLCPRCAYPLPEPRVCPECGTSAATKVRSASSSCSAIVDSTEHSTP